MSKTPDLHLKNLKSAEDGGGEGGAVQEAGHEALVLRLRQVLVLAQDLAQLLVSHSLTPSEERRKKNEKIHLLTCRRVTICKKNNHKGSR